jgi:hypothetical protein
VGESQNLARIRCGKNSLCIPKKGLEPADILHALKRTFLTRRFVKRGTDVWRFGCDTVSRPTQLCALHVCRGVMWVSSEGLLYHLDWTETYHHTPSRATISRLSNIADNCNGTREKSHWERTIKNQVRGYTTQNDETKVILTEKSH